MIVDAHVHMGIPSRPAFGNALAYTSSDLLRNMDRADVDMSLVMSIPHVYDNEYVIQEARKYPDRLIPWAYMDPWHHPRPADSVKKIAEEGFLGLKFRAVSLRYHLSDHYLLDPILEACRDNGLRVSMHTGDDPSCTPLQVAEMARSFPEITFLLIHGGFRMLTEEAILVAKALPNVYLDETAGNSWQLYRALEELAPEKIIYGSDSPFMDTRVELARFRTAIEDRHTLDLALGGNALRIFGLHSEGAMS